MKTKRTTAFKEGLLAGCLVTFYAVMLTFVWVAQTRMASARLKDLMKSCGESAVDAVDYNVEPEALRVARILVARWGDVETAAKADLDAALVHYDCEEINLCDTNDTIVAAANRDYIGFDMHANANTLEFTALNTGARSHVTQRFRLSKCRRSEEKGGLGLWLKYVGLPFPGGGYIQVGDSYRNFRVRFRRELENLMRNSSAGANGHYLLVDREDGTILSGFRADWSNRPLADSGICAETFRDDDAVLSVRVFGVDSFVRRIRLPFAEMDVYVVIPHDDIFAARRQAVGAAGIAFGVILLVGGLLFCKVLRQHARIEDLFAREAARIEKDLAMAKAIQTNALPSRFPPYPDLVDRIDIFARMITAKEVGGDFYDFFFCGPNRLALVIADVSGKGVPAALFMMRAKVTIQSHLKSGLGIVEAVEKTNHRLSTHNDAGMFVTAWIGIVDLTTGELEYVNAGHNPPLLKRVAGSVEYLKARSGLALAAMDGVSYRRQSLTLGPGDGLLLYTDGVTEAQNGAGAFYGEERLIRTMRTLLGARDAETVIGGVQKDVEIFAGGTEQADDITFLGFKLIARVGN